VVRAGHGAAPRRPAEVPGGGRARDARAGARDRRTGQLRHRVAAAAQLRAADAVPEPAGAAAECAPARARAPLVGQRPMCWAKDCTVHEFWSSRELLCGTVENCAFAHACSYLNSTGLEGQGAAWLRGGLVQGVTATYPRSDYVQAIGEAGMVQQHPRMVWGSLRLAHCTGWGWLGRKSLEIPPAAMCVSAAVVAAARCVARLATAGGGQHGHARPRRMPSRALTAPRWRRVQARTCRRPTHTCRGPRSRCPPLRRVGSRPAGAEAAAAAAAAPAAPVA